MTQPPAILISEIGELMNQSLGLQSLVMISVIVALGGCSNKAPVAAFSSTAPETVIAPSSADIPEFRVNSVLVKNGSIYVSHQKGLSISSDSGTTWTTYKLGCTYPGAGCLNGGVSSTVVTDQGHIFVGVMGGVSYSQDGGQHWTKPQIGENMTLGDVATGLHTDGRFVYASLGNLAQGATGYIVFDDLEPENGFTHKYVSGNAEIVPIGQSLFNLNFDEDLVYGGALMRQVGGGSWQTISPADFTLNSDIAVSLVAAGSNLVLSSFKGVYVSSDNGSTWTKKTPMTGYAGTLTYNGQRLYVVSTSLNSSDGLLYLHVFYSDDQGATWNILSIAGLDSFNYNDNGLSAEVQLLVMGSGAGGVAISTDGGANFRVVQ